MEESAAMKIEDALDQSRKLNFRPLVRTIYRVPDLLRKVNEEAYTPLISIGSFHYRSPKLQSMENFKLRFLEDFIKREWQTSRMKLDLILLENQLPLFIIKKLYELLPLKSTSRYPTSFLELTFNYYRLFNDQRKQRSFNAVTEMYSATQLAEAGLKFKPISSGSLIDLKFNEGVLEIQSFTLHNTTEIFARNVIAWEQCHYQDEAYNTDYFVMLDFLINTVKDVDLLVDEKIIVKGQGTNIRPTLPNNLCTGISYGDVSDDYSDICRQLVDFRKKRWYVILKSSLRKDYFRTPWMGAATIGAIILLILTLIQTVCTVISIFK
ncbi:hypothetical protein I3842_16G091200 [Carya illinoinensis]|uniref:Uncharacterized protein n=1 Tax=Carya illinoinensis TaxID=32201 RepID=A0A922A357_CARIL|nr:hypothetical protein I3842_16G091200 [Carya illinoinensis]